MINAAAAVMVVVFMTFALAGPLPPKEMGFILAVAVLLDATLVRLLLQPVVLRLLGPRAWWMPAWLDRLLPEVGLSHDMPEAETSRKKGPACGMSFDALKARQSEAWGSAPWEPMAARLAAVHNHLVARLAPGRGERWLDVGTGTGAVALRARRERT